MMELAYQHTLQHSAHSFEVGFFGGVHGRHFICIQSLDGLLSFYEQESFSFQLYLPNFLIPFTFVYLEKIDSFLFLNGFLTFECYTYETLASASGEDKKIMKKWDYIIGEGIIDIQTVKNGLIIVALSEKNVYGLNENGKLLFFKRFEFKPTSFCVYLTEDDRCMVAIATDEGFINVYEKTKLKWAMKIDQSPVCLRRIFLNQLPGGLLLLSDAGLLQCVYVGTHPSVYLLSQMLEDDMDAAKAEAELKDLQNKISNNDLAKEPTAEDPVHVDAEVTQTSIHDSTGILSHLHIDLQAVTFVARLQVLIHVQAPLVSTNSGVFLTNFSGRTHVESSIRHGPLGRPWSRTVQIIASYITSDGVGGCIIKDLILPVQLLVVQDSPAKEALYKLTVTTNKPVVDVNQLFKEVEGNNSTPNAIGLKFKNADEVTSILAAKFTQRYRVQSDFLPSITLPLIILLDKLRQRFKKNVDFEMGHSPPLPIDSYYEGIRSRHELTRKRKSLEEKLLKAASQYKIIQKKLLRNVKDATPKSSGNLLKLLSATSKVVHLTLAKLQETEEELLKSKFLISSLSALISNLLELSSPGGQSVKLIRSVFNPHVYDADDQGWLEMQEATCTFILRQVLVKSMKEKEKGGEIMGEPLQNASKLTRHISAFVDRIVKSTHDLEPVKWDTIKEIPGHQQHFSESIVPVGTKFANLKADKDEGETKGPAARCDLMHNKQGEEREEEQEEEKVKENGDGDGDSLFRENQGEMRAANEGMEPGTFQDDDDSLWDVNLEEMQI